jgi:uncharacterized small protein (DUF1192 family)
MDWDEPVNAAPRSISTGEVLDKLSVAELEARVIVLESEITRVRAEIARKRKQAELAASIFGG